MYTKLHWKNIFKQFGSNLLKKKDLPESSQLSNVTGNVQGTFSKLCKKVTIINIRLRMTYYAKRAVKLRD